MDKAKDVGFMDDEVEAGAIGTGAVDIPPLIKSGLTVGMVG